MHLFDALPPSENQSPDSRVAPKLLIRFWGLVQKASLEPLPSMNQAWLASGSASCSSLVVPSGKKRKLQVQQKPESQLYGANTGHDKHATNKITKSRNYANSSTVVHIVLKFLLEGIVDLWQVDAFTAPVLWASTPHLGGLLKERLVFWSFLLLIWVCIQDDSLSRQVFRSTNLGFGTPIYASQDQGDSDTFSSSAKQPRACSRISARAQCWKPIAKMPPWHVQSPLEPASPSCQALLRATIGRRALEYWNPPGLVQEKGFHSPERVAQGGTSWVFPVVATCDRQASAQFIPCTANWHAKPLTRRHAKTQAITNLSVVSAPWADSWHESEP